MIKLIIDGEPVGKGRPRFQRNGQPYTPEKTRIYEDYIKMCYRVQNGKDRVTPGAAVAVTIRACFGIPKRTSKLMRKLMLSSPYPVRPTKKPDADNITKIILDALNGLAWEDDKQITGLLVTKEYSEVPQVIVEITEVLQEGEL